MKTQTKIQQLLKEKRLTKLCLTIEKRTELCVEIQNVEKLYGNSF